MALLQEPRAIVDGSELEEQAPPSGLAEDGAATSSKGDGWLLTAPETEVAKRVAWLWSRQDQAMKNRFTTWKQWRLWRKGVRFTQVRREQDSLVLYVPPQTGNEPPEPNNADDLARNVVSVLMADPPVADAEPATDAPEDRQAAEFATRVLNQESSEGGINLRAIHEDALDKSGTYASAFEYACVDPYGGGWQPVKVLAHPQAISVEPDPRVNPMTGEPEPPYVEKYVREDGSLSDSAIGAKRQWLPSIRVEVLTGHHVRFIPETCAGIGDAEGVVICMPATLGVLRGQFEKEKPWTDEILKAVASHRPEGWKEMLAPWMKSHMDERSGWINGAPTDDALCFPYLHYRRRCKSYPKGAYIVTVGDKRVLHRAPWSAVTQGQEGAEVEEALDIPLAQVRQLDDHADGDPYGTTFLAKTGPMDEIVASIIGALLEYLDRFNHPREYLPLGSNVTPESLRDARISGIPIQFNPQGKPEFETIPAFPKEGPELVQFLKKAMEEAVGLSSSAQGQRDPNVQSGRHFQQMVEQSLVRLASVKNNSDDAFIRLCRIILQLMRAFYTVAQRMKYLGEDGRYKERAWSRTDLGSTKDIKIRRGTSTLLPRSAKMALAREELDVGMKAQDPQAYTRYQAAIAGHLSPLMGLQDDPSVNRIRQQIADWQEGPDESVTEASAAYQQQLPMLQEQQQQQMQMMAMQATQQGMMPPEPPPLPPDPMTMAAARFFAPRPTDDDPFVARVRYDELGKSMQSTSFSQHPEPWQQPFVAEYLRMRMAAGVQTVADQQRAMQEQAAQQQQQVATEQESKLAEADKDRAVAADERSEDRAAESERESKKADLERQRMSMQAAARIATANPSQPVA
jgi:hypothetical protein